MTGDIEEHSPPRVTKQRALPAPEHPTAALPPPKPRSSRWRWLWLPVIVLLGTGVWYLWSKGGLASAGSAPAKAGKKGSGGVMPVVAVKVRKGNIGVYINGLGSVVPLNTVTVRSRVDGQLMSIHYKEGDLVKEGDLLVEIDPRPYQVQLEQAEGQMARDQANLQNAKVDLDRYTKLLTQNAIPEQQVATQKATVAQDEGVVKSDQGTIDSAKLNLVYTSIKAPISGRIGLRLVDPGNIVHATDTNGLLVITQIQPISVIFTVAEDDLPAVLRKLAAGQHLQAFIWDRGNTAQIGSGTLTTVDNQIDPTTGSLRLRADVDNSHNQLFPNQFVNVRLLVEEKNGVTLVTSAAIQRAGGATSPNSTYAYLVQTNNTVTVRQVTEGVTQGDDTQITNGLAPGDVVVMTGVDKLQEGSPVNVQMADDQGGGKTGTNKSGGKKK